MSNNRWIGAAFGLALCSTALASCSVRDNGAGQSPSPEATALNLYWNSDTEKQLTAGGSLSTTPSACKDQQWEVNASVDDSRSGAKVSVAEGVSLRVGAQVTCP